MGEVGKRRQASPPKLQDSMYIDRTTLATAQSFHGSMSKLMRGRQ
jgi:hypothetical protein